MKPNHLSRPGFAFLNERLNDAFENNDEKRLGVHSLGLDQGFVNFQTPADISAVHPVSGEVAGFGL